MLNMMTRRAAMALAVSAALVAHVPVPAVASEPIRIGWRDLIPQDGASALDEAAIRFGVVEHGEITEIPEGSDVVTDYNRKLVELAGFVIPLEYSGTGVTAFMLVPFVGACIHVPPPPPNQLVFVTAEEPFEVDGLFEPVSVTGEFNTMTVETELAEVGYTMDARSVEPYEQGAAH